MSQDTAGAPEKLGPCGNEGGGTATNKVTAFQEGQKITVTIEEVVFHPGHYRIALSMKGASDGDKVQADFPADPAVTMGPPNSGTKACTDQGTGSQPCGNVPIENPPVFPVLADDVFEHCDPFTAPQSVTVTLPAGVTCDKCTIQVLEFMSDHGLNAQGGCFYHHCADVSIQSVTVDGGSASSGASESDATTEQDAGGESSGASESGASVGSGASSGAEAQSGAPAGGSTSGASESGSETQSSGAGASGSGAGSGVSAGTESGAELTQGGGSSGGGCAVSSRAAPGQLGFAGLLLALSAIGLRRRR